MQFHKYTLDANTHIIASRHPSDLIRIQGYFRGTTADRWLHLFDASALPANGIAPLAIYPLYQTAPFHWGFDPGSLLFSKGIVAAVSTTQATLTISTDEADFMCDYNCQVPESAPSYAGASATADEILDISTAACTVYWIRVRKTAAAGAMYAQVFDAQESELVSGTTVPVAQQYHVAAGSNVVYEFDFGSTGRRFSKCCVALSSTGNVYTALGSNSAYLEAAYTAI